MSYTIKTNATGLVDASVNEIWVSSTDTYAQVTTQGYFVSTPADPINPGDIVKISYNMGTASPGVGWFTPTFSATGLITMVPVEGGQEITTTPRRLAIFQDTFGSIDDATSGSSPVSVTIAAAGQTTALTIIDPGTATANIPVVPAALVSGNLIKASGTGGRLVDAGARLIAGTTSSFAGGGTTNTFTVTGLTSAAVGSCVIRASTNSVSITKALPGTNQLAITFSADPGASTTVDYIYSTAAQT